MTTRPALLAAFAAVTLSSSPPAHADASDVHVYATVDAVETSNRNFTITGIRVGDSAATTQTFDAGSSDYGAAERCERFAVLAMSKPGKYELTVTTNGSWGANCKLALRAP